MTFQCLRVTKSFLTVRPVDFHHLQPKDRVETILTLWCCIKVTGVYLDILPKKKVIEVTKLSLSFGPSIFTITNMFYQRGGLKEKVSVLQTQSVLH